MSAGIPLLLGIKFDQQPHLLALFISCYLSLLLGTFNLYLITMDLILNGKETVILIA